VTSGVQRPQTALGISALALLLACQSAPQPVRKEPVRAELGQAFACLPTCYQPEAAPPEGCAGQVSCESRGSLAALAMNVVSHRFSEAQKASAAKDMKTCEGAARAILLGVRGFDRVQGRARGDFITTDGQHWTEAAAKNALADLATEAATLIVACGGTRETAPADELAFYGTGQSSAPPAEAAAERGVSLTIEGPTRVCPGQETTYVATVELEGGVKRRGSRAEMTWSVTSGAIDDGVYRAPLDAAGQLGPAPVLKAQHDSGLEKTLQLQLDFRCPRVVDASGQPGVRGAAGEAATGKAFGAGMSAPTSYKQARQMLREHYGGPGKPGGNGGPAGEVHVYIAGVTGASGPLALVRVVSQNGTQLHVVDPAGPGLVIDASGGKGGAGGEGGEGARGTTGEDAPMSGRSAGGMGGWGGPGGDGARGGNGGAGGRVTVHYDRKHPELQSVVKVLNDGGDGGDAGAGGLGGAGGHGGFGSMGIDGLRRRRGGPTGVDGERGPAGQPGRPGARGPRGPKPVFVADDAARMFAVEVGKGVLLR